MNKHAACQKECQQAVDYGVWPERSCSPVCVYLRRDERMAGEIEYDSWIPIMLDYERCRIALKNTIEEFFAERPHLRAPGVMSGATKENP